MYDFTILIASGAYASSVATTLDMLTAAAKMAPRVGAATPTWRVRSLAEGRTCLSNGLYIDAKPLPKRVEADSSIYVIPGLATDSASAVDARLSKPDALLAVKALKAHARTGGTIAASCAGVFLLQAAGLLKDRKATTTWWLASHLQQAEPRCTVDANRMVIADGPIWTAGAAFAQTDLMLQLLRMRFGAALADAVSRVLLIDGRDAQAPFIVPAMLANGNDFIARLSQQIDGAFPNTLSIVDIAKKHRISERTLARRIKAATGKSPSALIQFVRLKRARILLETSRMSIDQIAEHIGYSDATALRRLMRKVFGTTPRQFRPSIHVG